MIFSENSTAGFFLEAVFDQIASGWLPSGRDADTAAGNYFQVLNWHPYVGSWKDATQRWVDANKAIYQVAVDRGYGWMKVFLTEFGYTDAGEKANIDGIGEYFPAAMRLIRAEMPFVEAVHIFRLLDWQNAPADVNAIERTFGLFTSPNNKSKGCEPKPAAIALFKMFNGEDADVTPLYKYAVNKP
jgi:hypothetical protein